MARRKLALLVEYDGTDRSGFQLQAASSSVQGALEEALNKLTGGHVRVHGASRTDAGAHALGQVATFTTDAEHTPHTVRRALNFYLPEDIRIREAVEVAPSFDPRRDAVQRWYRYTLANGPAQPPLLRRFSHWVPQRLDVGAMARAAQVLLGTHDFRLLAGGVPPGRSTLRRMDAWSVRSKRDLVVMDVEGNAFLPQQIRKTVGALVLVGRGLLTAEALRGIVDGRPAVPQPKVLPARGLCLMEVRYPQPLWSGEAASTPSCIMATNDENS